MVVVVIGAVITFKYVKETKNKTYDEIAQMYYGKDENDPSDQVCFEMNRDAGKVGRRGASPPLPFLKGGRGGKSALL